MMMSRDVIDHSFGEEAILCHSMYLRGILYSKNTTGRAHFLSEILYIIILK